MITMEIEVYIRTQYLSQFPGILVYIMGISQGDCSTSRFKLTHHNEIQIIKFPKLIILTSCFKVKIVMKKVLLPLTNFMEITKYYRKIIKSVINKE